MSGDGVKTVAIVQSNYIPWKGYFDLIASADEFILLDDVQYTKRDWRNRNKIKTAGGPRWLSIPVQVKGKFHQKIRETRVANQDWLREHWNSIAHHYAQAPHFADYRDRVEALYRDCEEEYLSLVNHRFLTGICAMLGIETRITWSSDYDLVDGPTERLASLCEQAGATLYLSGPAARDYMDEGVFAALGIRVAYMDYSGYPEYPQLHPPFEHAVTALDLVFNTGPDAPRFMKCVLKS